MRARIEALKIYNDLTTAQLRAMKDSVLHLSIAHAAKMLGELEEASRFASEAIDLYPDDPQAYMILGELYEATGRFEDAEDNCRKALERNDSLGCEHPLRQQNVYFTQCCLGSSLLYQGKHAEADGVLCMAADGNSCGTLAFKHLVCVYLAQGRREEALQLTNRLRGMDPDDESVAGFCDDVREGRDVQHLQQLMSQPLARTSRSRRTTPRPSPPPELTMQGQVTLGGSDSEINFPGELPQNGVLNRGSRPESHSELLSHAPRAAGRVGSAPGSERSHRSQKCRDKTKQTRGGDRENTVVRVDDRPPQTERPNDFCSFCCVDR